VSIYLVWALLDLVWLIIIHYSMHLVISSLFLPSIAAYLSQHSQVVLLRSHLVVSLTWYIALGRPNIDIDKFMDAEVPSLASVDNAWLSVIQESLPNEDEHFCTLQRTLAHFAQIYGTADAGFVSCELEGAEKLDGSIFIRAAVLTTESMKHASKTFFWDIM
jgi:hypothetical protein